MSWPPWAWHTTAAPRDRGRAARSARHVGGGRPRRSARRGGATVAAGEGDDAGAATETATARPEAIAVDGWDGSERVGGRRRGETGGGAGREDGWEGVGVEPCRSGGASQELRRGGGADR